MAVLLKQQPNLWQKYKTLKSNISNTIQNFLEILNSMEIILKFAKTCLSDLQIKFNDA